jgi:hypothetical protein
LNELKEMSNEPAKKVVIENEPKQTEEVVIENEEVVSQEIKEPIKESIKATDDDVISMLDNVSSIVLKDVISLIDETTKSYLSNAEAFYNLDFSEHNDLIYSEVKKRVGVLLNK